MDLEYEYYNIGFVLNSERLIGALYVNYLGSDDMFLYHQARDKYGKLKKKK